MRKLNIATLAAAGLFAAVATAALPAAQASEGNTVLVEQDWTWQGIFGHYDKAQLQRGWQVYRDVCSSCHSMNLVRYRNLTDIGLSADQVKEIAAGYEVEDGPNDEGEMFMRPALPADAIKAPFPNDQAARFANGGALPPDLSLMAKARKHGPDYLWTLLTHYEEPPEDVDLMPGMSYNPAFPGHQIAMPQMIFDDSVYFDDENADTSKEAIAADVTAFLMWTAEPKLEDRKNLGIKVMLFLLVMTGLFYALKKRVWKDVEH
jgi:cytochrome c1